MIRPNRSRPKPRSSQRSPWARPKRTQHSQLPHDCVVLGVDTAQKSGWCLMIRGIYVSSGEFDLLRHPEQLEVVCKAALELGRANGGVPAALVYEKPFGGTGQGQYCGAWKCAWSAAGGVKTRFVGVYPSRWRSRVLGRNYSYAERDTARRAERQVAQRISGKPLVGNDEAPGVCIAKWGSHAGEVEAKLPPSGRTKALGVRAQHDVQTFGSHAVPSVTPAGKAYEEFARVLNDELDTKDALIRSEMQAALDGRRRERGR